MPCLCSRLGAPQNQCLLSNSQPPSAIIDLEVPSCIYPTMRGMKKRVKRLYCAGPPETYTITVNEEAISHREEETVRLHRKTKLLDKEIMAYRLWTWPETQNRQRSEELGKRHWHHKDDLRIGLVDRLLCREFEVASSSLKRCYA